MACTCISRRDITECPRRPPFPTRTSDLVDSVGKLLAKGNDDLATHLSRNNALPEYGETDEEVLITAFKRMLVAYDTAPEESKHDAAATALVEVRTTGKKNARLVKVLHHEMLCVVLATQLLKLGPHFRRRREFTVTWLFTSIRICMGVSRTI